MSSWIRAILPHAFKQLVTVVAALALASASKAETPSASDTACGAVGSLAPAPIAIPLQEAAGDHLCSLTLVFTTGGAVLGSKARRALDQAAPRLIGHLAMGGHVLIEEHADAGTPAETHCLSVRRIEAVAAYLEAAWGISARRLTLRGWATTLPEGKQLPRTAETRWVTVTLLPARTGAVAHRTGLRAPGPGHLDLDDFGGARNPLPGPQNRNFPYSAPSDN